MSKHLVPLILLGSAVGAIKRGEDGLAIGILCGVAVMLLALYILDEMDEARRRRKP